MLEIGITGGIGAGKSTVCRIFQVMGASVYEADNAAKRLMQKDVSLRRQIVELVGTAAYDESGMLNNKYIASVVFNNQTLLEQLNALVHPAVAKDYATWIAVQRQKGMPYVLKESALIFEIGGEKKLDAVILVTASEATRIRRILQRDKHRSEEQIRAIMKKQLPDEEKEKKTPYIIRNEDHLPFLEKITEFHQLFSFGDKEKIKKIEEC